ncbi:MAG: hypothetical protein GVY32_07370 [Gammaproteobacteria bacterium]|jgi:hypothetical protein|nr:hypothetical protein [Gammaproteobacteria bacterium]
MNEGLSYRLARRLSAVHIGAWIPPLFAVIGLIMVGMYLSGSTDDGGVLGFGVANLILSLHLLTVRGLGQLVGDVGKNCGTTQAAE